MISVLIPTHNRRELLERTLMSVQGVAVPPGTSVELVVVANACTDDTVAMCRRVLADFPWPARVVVEDEAGLNIARTRAVHESQGMVCAFLDDDVQVDPKWLVGLEATYHDHPADVVGGKVELWWEEVQRPEWVWPGMDGLLSRNVRGNQVVELRSPGGIIGANFSFRRAVFDKVGEFRPDLDRKGTELRAAGESEFVQRALAAGFRAFYSPLASIEHWVPASRVTEAYLGGVAYGKGFSSVLMHPGMRPARYLRCLAGHLWLVTAHGGLEAVHRLRGDRRRWMRHYSLRQIGFGGLAGAWRRLAARP